MTLTPVTTSYPGVYVAEQPSGVRTISGVATSITAFVGRARRGPVDEPVRISSWADFEREFGGLWEKSHLGYSVNDFFRLGGGAAVIVRVHNDKGNDTAQLAFGSSANALTLHARSPGTWGSQLTATSDHDVKAGSDTKTFNLTVTDPAGLTETFRNVSVATDSLRRVDRVVNAESQLVRITQATLPTNRPAAGNATSAGGTNDGDPITAAEIATPDAARRQARHVRPGEDRPVQPARRTAVPGRGRRRRHHRPGGPQRRRRRDHRGPRVRQGPAGSRDPRQPDGVDDGRPRRDRHRHRTCSRPGATATMPRRTSPASGRATRCARDR